MNVLELRNIKKSYDDDIIIDNMSFNIEERSIVAIIGKSGSGKTTILNMIGLLEPVDGGDILLNDKPLPSINSKKATMIRRNQINYLFQSNALINDATALQNLLLAMEFVGGSKKEKIAKIKTVLEELQIGKCIHKKINTLSGGEQQRVAMARCILKPGDVILADEPTGSLDPVMSSLVFELLLKLRDSYGKTIVIVTHDMKLAEKADRIINITEYNKKTRAS